MKYHKSKNMKKTIIVFMSVLLMGFMLTGCGNSVKKTLCDGGWIIEDKGIDGKLWLYFHEDNTFVFEELNIKYDFGKPAGDGGVNFDTEQTKGTYTIDEKNNLIVIIIGSDSLEMNYRIVDGEMSLFYKGEEYKKY